MRLHRAPLFLRAYHLLPHRLLNGAALRLSRARRPRWLLEATISAWARRGNIDLGEFEPGPFATLEAFFLRRLRPGARPIGEGLVSPVDGVVVEAGTLEAGDRARTLRVKGSDLSLDRLLGEEAPAYAGGQYAVIFLTPDGYHRIHAPQNGTLVRIRSITGRYFPQNDDALRHIPRVYERNERAVLTLRTAEADGGELRLVLVGASLVGGIELAARPRASWALPHPVDLHEPVARGDEIGHFRFGSTVVVLLPAGAPYRLALAPGRWLKMGETLAR